MVEEQATVGRIAREFQVTVHQVEYVIRTRGVKPHSRAGNALVYDGNAVDQIGRELRRIASSKGGRG